MKQGIKDKVAIIGMGCTNFGELWDKSAVDLVVEAAYEAFEDSGIEAKDIDAAWLGNCYEFTGLTGRALSAPLKLQYKPVTRVENACATGSDALRNACYAVAAGAYNTVLALGVEKLKDTGISGLSGRGGGTGTEPNITAPGKYALLATKYFAHYGLSPEEGKEMLSAVSVKSHHNATLNPKAHLRMEVTLEQVMRAPVIAWPLGLFDCCGVSDGAAAAIVVRAEEAKKLRPDPVYIKAIQISTGPEEGLMRTDYDYVHVEETVRAAAAAYAEAGIKVPRDEISMAEVHDCFSITEAVTMEDLMISPRGTVRDDILSGYFNLDGRLPVQPDGGLKCFGHPIGASGLRMMYEMYKQLQGKAGQRQINDPKIGLTHNLGGQPAGSIVSVSIVGI